MNAIAQTTAQTTAQTAAQTAATAAGPARDSSSNNGSSAPHSADSTHWQPICALDDIWPGTGVCALVGRRQIAIFRLADGSLYALDNHDPNSGANVLSRGIVGDLGGEPVVASPIYKHHYRLRTGACVENADTPLRTYAVELRADTVWLQA